MAEIDKTRRQWWKTVFSLSSLALGVAFLSRFFSLASNPSAKKIKVPKNAIPQNGALVYPKYKLAIIRNKQGFLALNLTCTHLGCLVQVHEDGLHCPCHGSCFDFQGQVTRGPASSPLRHYPLEAKKTHLKITLPSRG